MIRMRGEPADRSVAEPGPQALDEPRPALFLGRRIAEHSGAPSAQRNEAAGFEPKSFDRLHQ